MKATSLLLYLTLLALAGCGREDAPPTAVGPTDSPSAGDVPDCCRTPESRASFLRDAARNRPAPPE